MVGTLGWLTIGTASFCYLIDKIPMNEYLALLGLGMSLIVIQIMANITDEINR